MKNFNFYLESISLEKKRDAYEFAKDLTKLTEKYGMYIGEVNEDHLMLHEFHGNEAVEYKSISKNKNVIKVLPGGRNVIPLKIHKYKMAD